MIRTARLQLFTGKVRSLPQSGRPSGIYKTPLTGPTTIGSEGLVGDEQADRRVHGGPEKAIHLYPAGHYRRLAERFGAVAAALVPGSMGENLSTADLDESTVRIGDLWQLGSAVLQVCQPRNPCWKIDERFGCDGMAAYIAEHRLTGWYFRVTQPGTVTPGDALLLQQPASDALTLQAAQQLCQEHRPPLDRLAQLASTPGIASQWQDKLQQRLNYLQTQT